ncbi:MAG: TssQ family T6SS-associated lipoprotein [Burkholderiales bacterium]|nr:TssQ family T6SS-associated lipoprotein [Burkholderiales bacterium]
MRLLIIMLLLMPLLTGCEAIKKGAQELSDSLDFDKARAKSQESALPTAEARLKSGIARYEEGNYGEAQRLLQSSLAEGLASRTDQARAYKHLAFIYCITERLAQCRQEFSNALSADPKFNLSPAEAGHPTWGPVFRSVSRSR